MKRIGLGMRAMGALIVNALVALAICITSLIPAPIRGCEYGELVVLDTFVVTAEYVEESFFDLFDELNLDWVVDEFDFSITFTNYESSEFDECEGANPFTVADGNVKRRIDDLTVGATGLTFRRTHNSKERTSFAATPLGNGGNWRHNWQFDLISTISPDHGEVLEFCYPDGRRIYLAKQADGSYRSPEGTPESATVNADGGISLQLSDGSIVGFSSGYAFGKGRKYIAQSLNTVEGVDLNFSTDAGGNLTSITDTNDNWIRLAYRDIKLTGNPYKDLLTVKQAPAAGAALELVMPANELANSIGFFVRIPNGASVSEVQFFAEGSDQPYSGTYGNEYCQAALDGNRQTVFVADSTRRTIGFLFPVDAKVKPTKLKVFAAPGTELKLLESKLVIKSAKPPESTIAVISGAAGSNGRSVGYEYETSDQTHGFQASLSRANYGDGTSAEYKYSKRSDFFGGDALLVEADDPRYAGGAKHISYTYYRSKYDALPAGTIKQEINPRTKEAWATLEIDPGTPLVRRVSYSNERSRTYFLKADGSGRVEKRVDGVGRATTFDYEPGEWGLKKSASIKGKGNRERKATRDNRGRITAITQDNDGLVEIDRDARGRVLRKTLGKNDTTTYTRDNNGRITRIEHNGAVVQELVRDTKGRVVTRKSPGKVRTATYDSKGRIATVADQSGETKHLGYDAHDNLVMVTDSLGRITRIERNERGQVTGVTNPAGLRRSIAYDKYGRKISETDEHGGRTSFAYDDISRVTKITDAFGGVTHFDYSEIEGGCSTCSLSSRPSRVTSPSGVSTSFILDSEGRILTRTIASGTAEAATYFYQYDDDDNVTESTDPVGNKSTYQYDGLNRLISQTDGLGRVTTREYTSANTMRKIADAAGGVTRFEYDSVGRRVAAVDPAGNNLRFAYNAANRVNSLTTATGAIYGFGYDSAGRRNAITYPDGSRESWTYNASRQTLSFVNRNGQTRSREYNAAGQLMAEKVLNDPALSMAFTYAANGQVETAANGAVKLRYTYDGAGRLATETTNVAGTSWTVAYGYDANTGRIVSAKYPSGLNVERAFSPAGRLSGIKADGAVVAVYTYDELGRPKQLNRENGITTKWSWDAAHQLKSVEHQTSAGPVAITGYEYGLLGERKVRANLDGSVLTFEYDALRQVTGASTSTTSNGNAADLKETFKYDKGGNWERYSRFEKPQNGPATNYHATYSTGSVGQYTSITTSAGSIRTAYDSAGNQTALGDYSLRYDAKNQLVEVSSSSERLVQTYDAWGRVVLRRYYTNSPSGWIESTNQSRFVVYDGGRNVVEEISTQGAWIRRYLRNGRTEDAIRVDVLTANETRSLYPMIDGSGSTVAVADSSATVISRIKYDSYGRKQITGEDVSFIPLFTGRHEIGIAGLYDHRRRFYSPDIGRWLTPDPSGMAGGLNLYAYALNDPIARQDLSGLASIEYRPLISTSAKLGAWLSGYDPVHYTIFFDDGLVPPNASYGEDGVVQESAAKRCLYNNPGASPSPYNNAIMRKAVENLKNSGNWDPSDYGYGSTCQEFVDEALEEYDRIANDPNLTQQANDEQAQRVASQGGG